MILEFMTKRNQYGHRNYIFIDTDAKIFSRICNTMICAGIEIKHKDMKTLVERCKQEGYTEISEHA